MKKKMLMIGAVPPPYHGSNISFARILQSDLFKLFNVHLVDSSDHRDGSNIGKLDLMNIYLALKNLLQVFFLALVKRPDIFYIRIAQDFLPYLRDGLQILAVKIVSPRTKIVIHLDGGYFFEFYKKSPSFVKWFIDLTMKCVSDAIVLGECLQYIFEQWLTKSHIHVVPNGTTFNPELQNKFTTSDSSGPISLIYLSTVIPSKGILDVLDAVKEIVAKGHKVHLTIAGERKTNDPYRNRSGEDIMNEYTSRLQDKMLKGTVNDRILLKGSDKDQALIDTDVFLLPTYYPYEGLPNAILEAMAAGNVIISTKHAAIPEVIIDGQTGFFVEKQNSKDIAARLIQLDNDRMLLSKMQQASRKRFENEYTAEKSNTKLVNVFLNIAER